MDMKTIIDQVANQATPEELAASFSEYVEATSAEILANLNQQGGQDPTDKD